MGLKKFLCGALAATMIFSASMFCSAAAPESVNAKLARIEVDTYGAEQSGALLDRISRLEKSYSGRNMSGNMNARIEAIYDILYNNDVAPGVLAKLNALEWNVNHEVASAGVDLRLAALENQILGKTSDATFNERIRALAKASYGAEILPISQIQIPANTLIKIETTMPVSSKTMQEGDIIPVRVVEDVFIENQLVFARGLPGEGNITKVVRAKNIFSNGKIETDFYTLKTIDGQDAQIFTGIESVEMMTNNSMARGLSLIGQTFSGKNKDLEEFLVRGKNIDLPAGIELYVQIEQPIVVYGVRTDGGGIFISDIPTPEENSETGNISAQPSYPDTENISAQPSYPDTLTEDEHNARPDRELEPAVPVTSEPAYTEPQNDDEIIEIVDED